MDRIAIPIERVAEKREPRPRRPRFDGERAVELYFTVLTVLILGMIVGLAAFAVNYVIPAWQERQSQEWQRSHSPMNLAYPHRDESPSRSPDLK